MARNHTHEYWSVSGGFASSGLELKVSHQGTLQQTTKWVAKVDTFRFFSNVLITGQCNTKKKKIV